MGGTEFGLQPMPTLGDVEIKYKNRGSLRESNLTIKCFNPKQFQIVDTLYLHLGYTVLLEWGNSSYFDNKGGYISDNKVSMQELMFDPSVQQDHLEVLKSILDKREKSNGNYDAFYGKIANYSWTFDNGVYNISLKLISLGDIIESLNMNYLSVGVEEEVKDVSKNKEEEEEVEKTIKSEKDKNDLARLFYYAKISDAKISYDVEGDSFLDEAYDKTIEIAEDFTNTAKAIATKVIEDSLEVGAEVFNEATEEFKEAYQYAVDKGVEVAKQAYKKIADFF